MERVLTPIKWFEAELDNVQKIFFFAKHTKSMNRCYQNEFHTVTILLNGHSYQTDMA